MHQVLVTLSVVLDHAFISGDAEQLLVLDLADAFDVDRTPYFVCSLVTVRVVFSNRVHFSELEVLTIFSLGLSGLNFILIEGEKFYLNIIYFLY